MKSYILLKKQKIKLFILVKKIEYKFINIFMIYFYIFYIKTGRPPRVPEKEEHY